MQRSEEDALIKLFKNRYKGFPKGEILYKDKPDFIIKSDLSIGIELTQVFKDQDNNAGSFLKKKQQFKIHLLENIVSKLKEINFPICILDIDFNDLLFTGRENPKDLARQCFENIVANRARIGNEGAYVIQNHGTFSKLIQSYSLYVSKDVFETEFVLTGGSVGEAITNDHIQFILDKKEKAKAEYKNCDEYWLVIFEGSFEADHFGKIQIEPNLLITSFKKVFLLRQFLEEAILIKENSS